MKANSNPTGATNKPTSDSDLKHVSADLQLLYATLVSSGDGGVSTVASSGCFADPTVAASFPSPMSSSAMTSDAAEHYILALHRHQCRTLKAVAELDREDLRELEVVIGHRRLLVSTAKRLQQQRIAQNRSQEQNGAGSGSSPITIGSVVVGGMSKDALSSSSSSARFRTRQVGWLALSGMQKSLDSFMHDVAKIRAQFWFPQSFDRLFYANRPMPFVERVLGNDDIIALLLRVPDLKDSGGTSVTTISNRVCFMINRQKSIVVTYHRCEEDLFANVADDWKGEKKRKAAGGGGAAISSDIDEDGELEVHECARGSVGHLMEMLLRCVVHTYRKAVEDLREAVDYAEVCDADGNYLHQEVDDTMRVQLLSVVAKKAEVYHRCAVSSKEALATLLELEWIGPTSVQSIIDNLTSVASICDEVTNNARGSMDTIIAMTDFRSSTHLKTFTYITIFMQPISVATSWYGMNWSVMPELEDPEGYFKFTGITLAAAVVFITWFLISDWMTSTFSEWFKKFLGYFFSNVTQNPICMSDLKAGRIRHLHEWEDGTKAPEVPPPAKDAVATRTAPHDEDSDDDQLEVIDSVSPSNRGDHSAPGKWKSSFHQFTHRVRTPGSRGGNGGGVGGGGGAPTPLSSLIPRVQPATTASSSSKDDSAFAAAAGTYGTV